MNKTVYQLMSVVVAFALTFGSFTNVDAAPQMAAATYYVSTTGNDANAGTSAAPFKTIQKCLDKVQPGDTCQVLSGTYNEALTLKISGTATARITLKCAVAKGCTVNSGGVRTLVTSTGQKGYYTVDGFRFISTLNANTVDFAYNYWGDGHLAEKGNDGFVLKNCYVEGAVYFYGSDNLVENCELNGKGIVENGITERSQPSENNIFRNNSIHDYFKRGGWSLQMTSNTLWANNTIYNIGKSGSGSGIDCDGAGIAVNGCNIKNSHFYNIPAESAILLENCFNCQIENNSIHDSLRAISAINYNKENGDGFHADKDYKGLMTNTIIKNNVIYNMSSDGLICKAVRGNQLLNNTFYNVKATLGYFGAIGLASYSNVYCPNWIIKGNIVSQSPKTIFFQGNPANTIDGNFYDTTFSASIYGSSSKNFAGWQAMGFDLKGKTGNPLFVNAAAGDFHLQASSPACLVNGVSAGAFSCGVSAAVIEPTYTVTNTSTPVVVASTTPSSTPVSTLPAPTLTVAATNTLSAASATPTASQVPASATPMPSSVPASVTPTASQVPATATPGVSSASASATPTASPVPASVTPTATKVPASATPMPSSVPASATPTASSVPTLVNATATPVPVLPTSTAQSVPQPTSVPQKVDPLPSGKVYDDKSGSFVFSAGWKNVTKKDASGGSYKETTKNGSSATFTFSGQSFSVIYRTGRNFRKIDVYVDGLLVGTINEKGSPVFQKSWDYPGQLTSGNHTLKLVFVTTSKIDDTAGSIDAVIVR